MTNTDTQAGAAGAVDPGLAAFAASIDEPAAAPASSAPAIGAPAPASIDYRQEARELWRIVGMLKLRWPSLAGVFTDQAIERLGETWAPILERHNLDLGKFTIYFVAATATAPVIGDALAAIRHDRAQAAAAPRELATPERRAPAASSATASAAPPIPSSSESPPAPPDDTRLAARA